MSRASEVPASFVLSSISGALDANPAIYLEDPRIAQEPRREARGGADGPAARAAAYAAPAPRGIIQRSLPARQSTPAPARV